MEAGLWSKYALNTSGLFHPTKTTPAVAKWLKINIIIGKYINS